MPLICPNCSYLPDESDAFCPACGHDFVDLPAAGDIAGDQDPVHGLVVDRFKVNCIAYGERLSFDPTMDAVVSRFLCGRFPGRIDCVGCPVCPACGEVHCTCGMVGISISVKTKGAVIETTPLRGRVGESRLHISGPR
ncbi:hypothetical protein [Oryzomonas rubra]|uniref:Zinc-ribbon domain-containing protein n=1 Tax=Oryzomonas rubra TaxID=2509454 RepID=A0A5A9X7W3_9BACT|nr:hypothetical protein [Oryzomonas rubra]KAA0888743.1 hypothetical protein ET418_15295 [Oryzomonas rubra]